MTTKVFAGARFVLTGKFDAWAADEPSDVLVDNNETPTDANLVRKMKNDERASALAVGKKELAALLIYNGALVKNAFPKKADNMSNYLIIGSEPGATKINAAKLVGATMLTVNTVQKAIAHNDLAKAMVNAPEIDVDAMPRSAGFGPKKKKQKVDE